VLRPGRGLRFVIEREEVGCHTHAHGGGKWKKGSCLILLRDPRRAWSYWGAKLPAKLMMIVLFTVPSLFRNKLRIPLEGTYSWERGL
jgi:hypothetical protein